LKNLEKVSKKLQDQYANAQKSLDHDAVAYLVGNDSSYYLVSKALRDPDFMSRPENGYLKRTGVQDTINTVIKDVDKVFEHPQAVAVEDITVYRGASFKTAAFKAGQIVEDKSYIAASADPSHAASFAATGNNRYLLQIDVPKGERMVVPRKAASYDYYGKFKATATVHEAQVLFPRGTKLRIESVGPKRGKLGIRLVRAKIVK
jgi:hypothetical protein